MVLHLPGKLGIAAGGFPLWKTEPPAVIVLLQVFRCQESGNHTSSTAEKGYHIAGIGGQFSRTLLAAFPRLLRRRVGARLNRDRSAEGRPLSATAVAERAGASDWTWAWAWAWLSQDAFDKTLNCGVRDPCIDTEKIGIRAAITPARDTGKHRVVGASRQRSAGVTL